VEERICSYRPCILCIAEAKNQRTMEDSLLMYETKNSSESEARGCRTAEREVEGGGVLGREFRNKKPVGSCRRNQPHHVLGRDAVGELVGAAHPEQRVPTCHLQNVRILRGVSIQGLYVAQTCRGESSSRSPMQQCILFLRSTHDRY
jgi:hypothetical protein